MVFTLSCLAAKRNPHYTICGIWAERLIYRQPDRGTLAAFSGVIFQLRLSAVRDKEDRS